MKNFKQVFFLLCISFIPLSVIAMEDKTNKQVYVRKNKPRNNPQSQVPIKKYIDLDDSKVEEYISYNLSGNDIQYYKEYHAQQRAKNLVSFPLDCCDPLPIESCGDIRFFFTSAVTGTRYNQKGEAYMVTDPSIKQMVVVRGKASNKNCAQVYIGFDPDNFKSVGYKGSKKIHTARIMAIQKKDNACATRNNGSSFLAAWSIMNNGSGWIGTASMPEVVKHLSPEILGREVRNHLPDSKNCGWNNPVFHEKLRELLGENYENLENGQWLLSPICYWTKEENKLKGTMYKSYTK